MKKLLSISVFLLICFTAVAQYPVQKHTPIKAFPYTDTSRVLVTVVDTGYLNAAPIDRIDIVYSKANLSVTAFIGYYVSEYARVVLDSDVIAYREEGKYYFNDWDTLPSRCVVIGVKTLKR